MRWENIYNVRWENANLEIKHKNRSKKEGFFIAFNIAWYEQKAVIVLLALLYLGVKNIHLRPILPGFLSSNVAKVLVKRFGIAGINKVVLCSEL